MGRSKAYSEQKSPTCDNGMLIVHRIASGANEDREGSVASCHSHPSTGNCLGRVGSGLLS